ncbi:bone morphogenetic protein 4 isoform X2 [Aethina tumida]|uniref:bone morphogenetic protein 4 isoform X2 n=1 Tax=Aethina tumida TaxID=116153 RepID=UPI0021476C86|nr:bone morphogenetic protein 4 isoform X2 [Aethina tumida]
MKYFLVLLLFEAIQSQNFTKKAYYFKMDQPRNEFKIHNRIQLLNYNVSDVNHNRPAYLRKAQKSEPQQKELFLDPEWEHNYTSYNNSELPAYFQKFYEARTNKLHNTNSTTTRFLFNENANTSSSIIKFNLGSLNENETIHDAELYFYWPLDNTSDIYKTSVVLRLYQLEPLANKSENEIDNPDVHKLFNVIYILKAQKGWQSFKVKKAFNSWMKEEPNLGLLLTISTYGENKLLSIFNDTNTGKFRTFAIIHIGKNDALNINKPESPQQEVASLINVDHSLLMHYSTRCQRKGWYVDFRRLHWNNFIIYPEGYTAFDCFGKCTVNDDEIANNHIKLLDFFKQRLSLCVPITYLPLPIMYYDTFGNIVLKNYENMIATNCGCR